MSGDKFRHYFPGKPYNWPSEGDYDTLTVEGMEKPSQEEFDALPWPPVPTLNEAKAAKWEQVKAIREAGKNAGVTVPGIGFLETDEPSRVLINGATTMAMVAAMAGEPFTMTWTLADNTEFELDGPQMIAVGVAAGKHVGAWHGWGQALRPLIEGAEAMDELNAIDITTGWPG